MDSEESEIRAVVDSYVAGFNRGDKELLLRALHPRFVSSGFFNDELQWDRREDFAAFCAEAAPDRNGPVPAWHMEKLTVSGRTAVAIVIDKWGTRKFRDSLTLLKDDSQWQIVFKAFHNLN